MSEKEKFCDVQTRQSYNHITSWNSRSFSFSLDFLLTIYLLTSLITYAKLYM
jgi:hypothetical protein